MNYSDYVRNHFIIVPLHEKHAIHALHKSHGDFVKKPFTGNIGLVCGKVNNIVCVDVDRAYGGIQNFEKLCKQHNDTSYITAPTQYSANGGIHYIYEYDPDIKRSYRLTEKPHPLTDGRRVVLTDSLGIDIISDGLHIAVEPSVVNGKQYKWKNVENLLQRNLQPLPQWIKDKILNRECGCVYDE